MPKKQNKEVAAEVVQPESNNPEAQAVAVRTEEVSAPIAAPQMVITESDNALSVMAKISSLPTINENVLKTLAQMHNDESDRQSRRDLHSALAKAKGVIAQNPILKIRTGDKGARYAELADILAVVSPALAAEGLSYSYDEFPADGNNIRSVITIRGYGAEIKTERTSPKLQSPVGEKSGKSVMNAAQESGAHSTYMHRYLLCAAVGVAASLDGNGATAQPNQPQQRSAPQNNQTAPPKTNGNSVDWHKINAAKKAAREDALANGNWLGGDSLTKEANSELLKTAIRVGEVKNADGLTAMGADELKDVFIAAMKEVGLIANPNQNSSADDTAEDHPF